MIESSIGQERRLLVQDDVDDDQNDLNNNEILNSCYISQ